MKKTRLNKRQEQRINELQKSRSAMQGLVLTQYGQVAEVETISGDTKGQIFRCYQRSNLPTLVPGDQVSFEPGEPEGVIVSALPRSNVLQRPNRFNALKPVAANVDRMLLLLAPQPQAHLNLIDRYLVAAVHSGLEVTLVLNKCELEGFSELTSLVQPYSKIGYRVFEISCKTSSGIKSLEKHLNAEDGAKTSICVGQSGVGKSALVNALLRQEVTREGNLSVLAEKGRHTTTAGRLYHLPQGGHLIDSPGIREFSLWHIQPEEVFSGFIEFQEFLGQCKFRDCKHLPEDSCALWEAVSNGKVSKARLQSYQHICMSMQQE
jgi:ribosome biogenesis GTPase